MGFITFLEENMLSCQWKEMGMECAGCGFQRSAIFLLKGEFIQAFMIYPAIYTLLIMFVYLGLHLRLDFQKGHLILKWLFVLNTAIILFNYFLKF